MSRIDLPRDADLTGGAMNERMSNGPVRDGPLVAVAQHDARAALRRADSALARDPGDRDWMLRRLQALNALDLPEKAGRQAAELVAAGGADAASLDPILDASLATGDARTLRTAIAQAEAKGGMTKAGVARAKAQLAIALGDVEAARAIIVAAIEDDPRNPALRAQLAEALMAAGSAGQARDVLTRIGVPPIGTGSGRGTADGG